MNGWCQRINEHTSRVFIRMTPNAKQDAILGITEAADQDVKDFGAENGVENRQLLRVAIRAIPEKGKANKALVAFLAKKLSIAKSDIEIIGGQTSRLKTLVITGKCEIVQDLT